MSTASSSCWTPTIRSSGSTVLLKFDSKALAKNLGLRKGKDGLNLTDWSKQQLDKELWRCWLAMRRSWRRRGLCLARLHCPISCISAGFCGQWWLWSRWPAYSSRGSASSLNCYSFWQIPNFFQLLVSKNKCFLVKTDFWNHLPSRNIAFMEKCLD